MGHLGGVVLSRWADGMEWVHVVSWDWRGCDVLLAFYFWISGYFFFGRYIGNGGGGGLIEILVSFEAVH